MRSSLDRAAPWVHALIISAGAGLGAMFETGHPTFAALFGAGMYGLARGAGWIVLRYVRPRHGHPLSVRVLRRDVEQLVSDLHRLNNRASVALGELEYVEQHLKADHSPGEG